MTRNDQTERDELRAGFYALSLRQMGLNTSEIEQLVIAKYPQIEQRLQEQRRQAERKAALRLYR